MYSFKLSGHGAVILTPSLFYRRMVLGINYAVDDSYAFLVLPNDALNSASPNHLRLGVPLSHSVLKGLDILQGSRPALFVGSGGGNGVVTPSYACRPVLWLVKL